MEDRFVVKNNSGSVLMLPMNRITLAMGASIELCSRLDKTVKELKNDREISLEIKQGNLVAQDEYEADTGLDGKIDKLLGLMEAGGTQRPMIDAQMIEEILARQLSNLDIGKMVLEKTEEKKRDKEVDEGKMREEALKKIVGDKKLEDSNLEGFGGKFKEVESDEDDDNNIDLIDF